MRNDKTSTAYKQKICSCVNRFTVRCGILYMDKYQRTISSSLFVWLIWVLKWEVKKLFIFCSYKFNCVFVDVTLKEERVSQLRYLDIVIYFNMKILHLLITHITIVFLISQAIEWKKNWFSLSFYKPWFWYLSIYLFNLWY